MKGSESFLSGRFDDPYGRPGDSFRIRESWHVCNNSWTWVFVRHLRVELTQECKSDTNRSL